VTRVAPALALLIAAFARVAAAQEPGGLGPTYLEPAERPEPPAPREATTTPSSPPESAPDPATAPRKEALDGLGVRGAASGAVTSLLGLAFTGWSGAVGLGGQVTNDAEVYVGVSYGQARTGNGLGIRETTLDATATAIVAPVHLGLGAGFMYMQIPRISEPNTSIERVGIGLHGWASVDLLRPTRRQALFIALRPDADWVVPQLLLRVTLGLGYRL
jgi:hypothetical protein